MPPASKISSLNLSNTWYSDLQSWIQYLIDSFFNDQLLWTKFNIYSIYSLTSKFFLKYLYCGHLPL